MTKNNSSILENSIPYLVELRQRLLRCVIVFGLVCLSALFFADKIYLLLAFPLIRQLSSGQSLIATAVPAPFLVPLKSACWLSIYLVVPYVLHQIWSFIAPALYYRERRMTWLLLLTSSLLFYLGTLFAYFAVLPIMFKFFLAVAPVHVEVKPDISEYLNFILKLFLAFGFSFEVPIITLCLTLTKICSITKLKAKRPYIVVSAFIVGMLLTPDVVSQVLLALPLWMLFELGLLLSQLMKKYES